MVLTEESERCVDVLVEEDEDDNDDDLAAAAAAAADDDDDDDGRLKALFEAAAAAARAACVTGMCMPRLGRDNDLRRVLYGIFLIIVSREQGESYGGIQPCWMAL